MHVGAEKQVEAEDFLCLFFGHYHGKRQRSGLSCGDPMFSVKILVWQNH